MYKKIVKDNFPETIRIDLGGQVLVYRKRSGTYLTPTRNVTSSGASGTARTRPAVGDV
jgi:hypothetical protein